MSFLSKQEFEQKKQIFVNEMLDFLKEKIQPDEVAKGVSFIPVLENGDKLVLGRENSGHYRHKVNFFGGSLQDKSSNPDHPTYEDIAGGLFEEVAEEFGVLLKSKEVKKYLIDIYRATARRRNGQPPVVTLMFLVAYRDFDSDVWKKVMSQRNPELSCWNEHEEAKAWKEEELDMKNVSSFVQGYIARIYLKARTQWNKRIKGVSYNKQEKIIMYS